MPDMGMDTTKGGNLVTPCEPGFHPSPNLRKPHQLRHDQRSAENASLPEKLPETMQH